MEDDGTPMHKCCKACASAAMGEEESCCLDKVRTTTCPFWVLGLYMLTAATTIPEILAKHKVRLQNSAGRAGIPVDASLTRVSLGSSLDSLHPM